jgi:hypothetical protein
LHTPRESVDPEVAALDRWVLEKFDLNTGNSPDTALSLNHSRSQFLIRCGGNNEILSTPSDLLSSLSNISLKSAIEICERVGALATGGYAERWAGVHDFRVPREKVRAAGFCIIAGSELNQVLDKVYEGFLASGTMQPASMRTAYGWFYHWFAFRGGKRFCHALAQVILQNAEQKFLVTSGTFHGLDRRKDTVTFSQACKRCRVGLETLRSILAQEQKIRLVKRKGSPIAVLKSDVERIRRLIEDSVPYKEVRHLLGVGGKDARDLIRKGLIPIWMAGGAMGAKHRYLFLKSDIEHWLQGIFGNARILATKPNYCIKIHEGPLKHTSTLELISQVMKGSINVHARLQGRVGLDSILFHIEDGNLLASSSARQRSSGSSFASNKHTRLLLTGPAREQMGN